MTDHSTPTAAAATPVKRSGLLLAWLAEGLVRVDGNRALVAGASASGVLLSPGV